MKSTLLVILVVIGIASCSDSDSEPQLLNGILTGNFVEVTPEDDRTTLIFSSNTNQLKETRISDGDDPPSRTFSIRLLDDKMIELSSNEADELFPRVFHYEIIDDDTFEIGNLNQNDPENTVMVFERN